MITMTKKEVHDLVLLSLRHHGIDIPETDQSLASKGVDSLDLFQAYLFFEELLKAELSESQFDFTIIDQPFSQMIDAIVEVINSTTEIKIEE